MLLRCMKWKCSRIDVEGQQWLIPNSSSRSRALQTNWQRTYLIFVATAYGFRFDLGCKRIQMVMAWLRCEAFLWNILYARRTKWVLLRYGDRGDIGTNVFRLKVYYVVWLWAFSLSMRGNYVAKCSKTLYTTQTLSTTFHSLPSSSSEHLLLIICTLESYIILSSSKTCFPHFCFPPVLILYLLWLFSSLFAWAFLLLTRSISAVVIRTQSMMHSSSKRAR